MKSSRSGPVSRRTVLLSVAGVIVGAGEVGLSITDRSAQKPHDAARLVSDTTAAKPAMLENPVPTSTPATISTAIPAWARRWNTPVHDLEDYLRRMPGTHLPARSVMMTVDDGPSAIWTPKFLRLFEKYDVKATFNLIGKQVPGQPTLVRAIASQGHTLANHTWTHDEGLPYRSPADIRYEIASTNDAIEKAARVRPKVFRAPGGVWGPRVFAELANEEMMPLGWDIDPRDWALPGQAEIEYAMLKAGPGDIILCHDGGGDRAETYYALERVLPVLKRRGYNFVTLPR